MKKMSKTRLIVSLAAVLLLYVGAWWAETALGTNSMLITVLKKGAVYALIAVSMNLLNGFTGLFSLGQSGFMLVGAYVYAVFTIPLKRHAAVYQYYNGGIIQFTLPWFLAMILAGLVAAYFAYDFATVFQGRSRHLSPALASMFSLCFSVFLLVGWEFYEFTMDRLYGYTLQRSFILDEGGLIDTMVDMILGSAGALIGMFWVAFAKNGIIGRNRKAVRERVKAQSRADRETELRYLAEHGYQP